MTRRLTINISSTFFHWGLKRPLRITYDELCQLLNSDNYPVAVHYFLFGPKGSNDLNDDMVHSEPSLEEAEIHMASMICRY